MLSNTNRYFTSRGVEIEQPAALAETPFFIEVRFEGGLTDSQQQAFKTAADRWSRIIIGDLPSVVVDQEVVDDVLIFASGISIDGPGGVLGRAGPVVLRPSVGASALLPATGVMEFDSDDLTEMENKGTLVDVITHEMGHVLGVGTLWRRKSLVQGVGSSNPMFVGTHAVKAYGDLGGTSNVPVENTGGLGTAGAHWRETIFRSELMSGFISSAGNPISAVTVGSLRDLGYEVDEGAAEPYELPNLLDLAERALLFAPGPSPCHGVLPTIPRTLPSTSLEEAVALMDGKHGALSKA